jgi:predicted kinase
MSTQTKKISAVDKRLRAALMRAVKIRPRITKKPIVVALIGFPGSGKSTIARELARDLGATVIAGDEIRIFLRKHKKPYDATRELVLSAIEEVIKRGGNVIVDSDAVDPTKRELMKARSRGVELFFVRTCCDPDVAIGRMITASYRSDPEDFFGGAATSWRGKSSVHGNIVKIREMWRRTPWHYRWTERGGGMWTLKKPQFKLAADIDTTDGKSWKRKVSALAARLRKL